MKVSVLFILSSICLAECYKLALPANSDNDLEYPRLEFASYVAIRELLSRLLFNTNNNVDLTGKIPSSMEEANLRPSADFEINSPYNTDIQPPFVVVSDPDFPTPPILLGEQTQGNQERPLLPTQLEAVNTNNNQPLPSPSPVNENSPTTILRPLPTNQNRPRPPSSSILAISNSHIPSNSASGPNSILPQPPQLPQPLQTPSSIETVPGPPELSNPPQELPARPQFIISAENRPIPPSSSNLNRPSPPIISVPSRPNPTLPNLAYLLSTLNQNGSIPSAPNAPFLGSAKPSPPRPAIQS